MVCACPYSLAHVCPFIKIFGAMSYHEVVRWYSIIQVILMDYFNIICIWNRHLNNQMFFINFKNSICVWSSWSNCICKYYAVHVGGDIGKIPFIKRCWSDQNLLPNWPNCPADETKKVWLHRQAEAESLPKFPDNDWPT